MFSTITPPPEELRRRGFTFMCGLLLQAALLATVAVAAVLFPEHVPAVAKHYVTIWLPPLSMPEKPALKPPPQVAKVVMPKAVPVPDPPKLPPAVAKIEPPKIEPPKIEHKLAAQPVIAAAAIPEPPATRSAPAAPRITVHTDVFGGSPEPVTTKRPVEQVQTGGFGSPEGLPGKAQGDSRGNVPVLGSFGLPEGPGHGNGTGGAHGVQGVVASAGFGSGVAGPGYNRGGGGYGGVSTGGFQTVSQTTRSSAPGPRIQAPAAFQPIEILSKPAPIYTEEARRLAIQGEVALSVIFQASGGIRVLGVVKSLGHGLDEAAQQAAAQIRFKPAMRSGQPEDFPATLRIEFRLAGQTS